MLNSFYSIFASLSLQFKGSYFLLILLAAAGIGLAYFSYRQTLPPTGKLTRIILALLRLIALFTLLFLIFEPTLSLHRQKELKPLLPVILDDTESMLLVTGGGDSVLDLTHLIYNPAWPLLAEKYDLRFLRYGDSLAVIEDWDSSAFHFSAIGTDLARALRELPQTIDEDEFQQAILISDGGNNSGRDPVSEAGRLDYRVFTVGIGDTARVRNAGIVAINGSETGYLGKESFLNVTLRAEGLEGQPAQLELLGPGGEILASKTIKLPPDQLQMEHAFTYVPTETGSFPLTVRLIPAGDDQNKRDNLRAFPLEVQESRIGLLLISAYPTFEAMFLEKALHALEDTEVHSVALSQSKRAVRFSELLNDADIVIVLGVSEAAQLAGWSDLRQALERDPRPIWFWAGDVLKKADLNYLAGSEPPFDIQNVRRKGEAEPSAGRYYAVLDPDAEADEGALWPELAPLQTGLFLVRPHPGATALIAFKDAETGEEFAPALLTWESATRRFMLSCGEGWWRWSFLTLGRTGSDEFYRSFIAKSIRWLAASPQVQPVTLTTDKRLYSTGETIQLHAQVQSADGEAVTSANVEVEVTGPDGTAKVVMEPDPQGIYRGSLQAQASGPATARVQAHYEGETLGRDSTDFSIQAYNIEKETNRQDYELLTALAGASGGEYIGLDSLAAVLTRIDTAPRTVSEDWSRRLFLHWDLWIVLIAALSLEWILRKRRGML